MAWNAWVKMLSGTKNSHSCILCRCTYCSWTVSWNVILFHKVQLLRECSATDYLSVEIALLLWSSSSYKRAELDWSDHQLLPIIPYEKLSPKTHSLSPRLLMLIFSFWDALSLRNLSSVDFLRKRRRSQITPTSYHLKLFFS